MQRPRRLSLALSLFLLSWALPLAAQIVVVPPGPTTETPVEIRASIVCAYPPEAEVTVTGFLITIHFQDGQICDPPLSMTRSARVPGLLAAGEYRVEIYQGGRPEPVDTTTFIVREAGPTPFRILPSAVPSDAAEPLRVRITRDPASPQVLCPAGNCAVRVGDTIVTAKSIAPNGDILFDAPDHAPGLVDVRIGRDSGGDLIRKGALYYFGGQGPPDLSMFERILFPVLFNAAGANGSDWRSEAAISNPRDAFLETYNDIQSILCIVSPCGERLAPGQFVTFSGGNYSGGTALLVPRDDAPALSFSLRVRDASRAAEGFGTQIPVVREADMFLDTTMTLLGVPLDPGYRRTLRVYGLTVDPFLPVYGSVTVVRAGGSHTENPREMTRACSDLFTCASAPAFATFDLPAGQAGERADVYVRVSDGALAWAFVSVTNNATQQVTIVTPDGRGEAPCTVYCSEE
jgi:hypothetical protein